jgi:predicted nucleic acid-binding Zn ribbon protein
MPAHRELRATLHPVDQQPRDPGFRTPGRARSQRGPGRSRDPVPLAESLALIRQRIGAVPQDAFDRVLQRWPSIVGQEWAELSLPESISHGVLRVRITEPALAEQFRWARFDMVKAINSVLGEELVSSISTHVGAPGQSSPPG